MRVKTFLINLDKDRNRLLFMSEQLSGLGIVFERFPAILGSEYIGDEYEKDLAIAKNGSAFSPGEIGCAISHKRCIQSFLDSDFDYCLILEDDVILHKDFKLVIDREIAKNENSYTKNNKYDWEYLQFDYWDPELFWGRRWWVQVADTFAGLTTIRDRLIFGIRLVVKLPILFCFAMFEIVRSRIVIGPVRFYRDIYLAGAYLINKSAAEKLLSLAGKVVYTADRLQTEAKKQKGLTVRYYSPVLALQNRQDFTSNIATQ